MLQIVASSQPKVLLAIGIKNAGVRISPHTRLADFFCCQLVGKEGEESPMSIRRNTARPVANNWLALANIQLIRANIRRVLASIQRTAELSEHCVVSICISILLYINIYCM